MTSTTESRSTRPPQPRRRPPAAASQARAIRSTGVTGSRRSIDWPEADHDGDAVLGSGTAHGPIPEGVLGGGSHGRAGS